MTKRSLIRASLLLLTATGCSAAGPADPSAPVASASAPTSTAVASAAPTPSASAVAEAEPPPPAAGLMRRYYRIRPPGDKDPQGGVPVSIDVPPEWGVELDRLKEPTFAPCRVESPVFGKLSLTSLSCGADTDLDACVDRAASFQFDKDEIGAAKVTKSGPRRRWIALDRMVHDHPQIHARLFAVDEKSRSAVMCLMLLSGKDRAFLPDYQKACESLVLRPPGQHDEEPSAVQARPRAADPGEVAPAEPPNAKAAVDMALSLLAGMQARDAKAVTKLLPADADCVEGGPKDKAHCREYAGMLRKHVNELFDTVAKDFQPGTVEVRKDAEMGGALMVTVHPKGDDCAEGKVVMVREMNKRLVVLFGVAIAKKEEHGGKPKK